MAKDIVNWEERLAADAKSASAVERPSVGAINTRAGVLSYMGVDMPNNSMDAVILDSYVEQSWYENPFDADNIVPPSCFALCKPGEESLLAPHDNVPAPVHDNCANCPKYQWGSGRGKGKACSTRRRLVLIPADALNDKDTLAKAEMAMLRVPVTSVRNYAKHVNDCAAAHNRPPWAMISRVWLTPDAKTQFKMHFEPQAKIAVELLPVLNPLLEQAQPILTEPFDMTPPMERPEDEHQGKRKY